MVISVSCSERTPAVPELLSFGPHITVGNYEVDNYYDQTATDLYAKSGHDHGEESIKHDEHSGELSVYLFKY